MKDNLFDLPGLGKVTASLFNLTDLTKLRGRQLRERLMADGLIRENDNFGQSQTYMANAQLIANILDEQTAFERLWDCLGQVLARMIDPESLLKEVLSRGEKNLTDNLVFYLKEKFVQESKEMNGLSNDELHVLNIIRLNFNDALDTAKSLIEYQLHGYSSHAWGLKYAAVAILTSGPEILITCLDDIVQTILQNDDKKTPSLARVFTPLLQEIINGLWAERPTHLIQSLLTSKLPLLRALACQAVIEDFMYGRRKQTISGSLDLFIILVPREQIVALAKWVYQLRIKSNRKGEEEEDIRILRCAIFNRLKSIWPNDLSANELR